MKCLKNFNMNFVVLPLSFVVPFLPTGGWIVCYIYENKDKVDNGCWDNILDLVTIK